MRRATAASRDSPYAPSYGRPKLNYRVSDDVIHSFTEKDSLPPRYWNLPIREILRQLDAPILKAQIEAAEFSAGFSYPSARNPGPRFVLHTELRPVEAAYWYISIQLPRQPFSVLSSDGCIPLHFFVEIGANITQLSLSC